MPTEREPVSLPEPVPADERAARRAGTGCEHALVGRIDRLAGAVECLIDVTLDIDLPRYADGRSCIGGANYGDALRALHASSRALRAVRDQLEATKPARGSANPGQEPGSNEASEWRSEGEREAYARFGKAVREVVAECYRDDRIDEWADELTEILAKFGLARRVKYDPEKHGFINCGDPGDEIWWLGEAEHTPERNGAQWYIDQDQAQNPREPRMNEGAEK